MGRPQTRMTPRMVIAVVATLTTCLALLATQLAFDPPPPHADRARAQPFLDVRAEMHGPGGAPVIDLEFLRTRLAAVCDALFGMLHTPSHTFPHLLTPSDRCATRNSRT